MKKQIDPRILEALMAIQVAFNKGDVVVDIGRLGPRDSLHKLTELGSLRQEMKSSTS